MLDTLDEILLTMPACRGRRRGSQLRRSQLARRVCDQLAILRNDGGMSAVGATPTYGPGGRCFCVVCADEAARRVLERRPPRSPGHTPFRTKPSPSNPRELFEYVDHTSPKYTPLSPKFTPMSLIPSSIHQPSPSSRLATGSPIREDREARVHFAPMMPTRIRPPVDETGASSIFCCVLTGPKNRRRRTD